MKSMNQQVQEAQQNPGTRNMKKTTPMHIITILFHTNDKEKNLKSSQEKDDILYTKIMT